MKKLRRYLASTFAIILLLTGMSACIPSSAYAVSDDVPVKSVKLSQTSITIQKGKIAQLKATVKPKNASNKEVAWKTSDSKIAKVDKSGKVTAVKEGKATITVTSVDGKKTAKCYVTVIKKDDNGSVDPIENNKLLEKYNLKISVYAYNDYMPYIVAPGKTPPPYPYPYFAVQFTLTQGKNIPNITVWAKITGVKNTLDIMLTCDGSCLEYNFETFYAGPAQGLEMETGETLTAVITFVIGNEKQTMTFYPVVKDVY